MTDNYVARGQRLLAQHDIETYRFAPRRWHRAVRPAHGGNRCRDPEFGKPSP
jgi:hypothetical protein